MEIKTIRDGNLVKQLTCKCCGKKLPVDIVDVQSSAVVEVFCKHCHRITRIEITQ